MAIKLDKFQRQDKKNLELETGHKWTARDYLINNGKLKNATDKDGWEYSRDTGSVLTNRTYQKYDAFSVGSTVLAEMTNRAKQGVQNRRRQNARINNNKNRKVIIRKCL